MLDFNERFNNLKNYRIHIVKNNLHKFIDIEKFNRSILKYKDHSFQQDGIYCVNYITKLLEENGLYRSNNMFPLPDNLLNKNNYTFGIKFEEPVIIKDIK